jgi:hypothetical protein
MDPTCLTLWISEAKGSLKDNKFRTQINGKYNMSSADEKKQIKYQL